MSHTTTIKAVAIQSVSALRAAVASLNSQGVRMTLEENAVPRAYFQNQQGLGKADFVVKLHDAPYDIGLYKKADGSGYEARTDFWGQHVEKILGAPASTPERAGQAKMGKLFQAYGVEAACEAARKKGHTVTRTVKADGSVQLVLTGNGL